VPLIWGFWQRHRHAAEWHDGQFADNTHARITRRANQPGDVIASQRVARMRADDRLREAIQIHERDWIASSLSLLAMTASSKRTKRKYFFRDW
jgi:hypothetical protein